MFICLRHRTQYLPPPYTLSTCIQNNYSHREGEGERVELERRGVGKHRRVQIPKQGWKYQHDWMYTRNWLSPVSKLWQTPAAKSLYRSIFRWHFALPSMSLIFLRFRSSAPFPVPSFYLVPFTYFRFSLLNLVFIEVMGWDYCRIRRHSAPLIYLYFFAFC